ncbi:hypothetical protein PR202_gb12686 [Eleusine coracana subsp. coracana]|uniref:Tyrosine-protein kinase catalytic domain-containing protein n=1 Tax=Eleusine coracana subsp. coracana TaxID=191504 RepID=A0AAV5ENL4_ELECO|nr:hypothetical protein PR202_gb12686 [Eleusine coracana subsp. coracana]
MEVLQLAGVDAFTLMTMIVRAANTAIQNKKTCLELAKQAEQIRDLLRSLEEQPGTSIRRRPETSAPLLDLHETLRRACMLVKSCRHGGCVRQFCAGGARAARLRDVQGKIDSFLCLFPIISYVDSTRLLVHVINSAAVRDQGSAGQLHGNDVTLKKHSVISSAQQLPWSMSTYELFKNEVKILPKLQHKNIVKLVGFCAERCERVLVYEYMQNGSLEDLIFVRMTAGPTVDWPTRFRIIEGIVQEYMKNGAVSVKTDVYSFGVIILEVISGKRWTKALQETYYGDLLTWAFKGTASCGKKLKLRLKDFMHPSIQRASFCGRTMPWCLLPGEEEHSVAAEGDHKMSTSGMAGKADRVGAQEEVGLRKSSRPIRVSVRVSRPEWRAWPRLCKEGRKAEWDHQTTEI